MFNTKNNTETNGDFTVKPNYNGDFTVTRVRVLNERIAKFTLNLCKNTVSLYDCSLVAYEDKDTGEEKTFFALPNTKGKNGEYYPTCYARLSDEMKDAIIKAVLVEISNSAYGKKER